MVWPNVGLSAKVAQQVKLATTIDDLITARPVAVSVGQPNTPERVR
jgi:hypothetical protein